MAWPLQENAIRDEEINALIEFLKSTDKYTQGAKVKEFENEWSKWQGCKHSVFVNSGSSANLILVDALKELNNWSDQTKVIVPAITWSTNIAPILQKNLKPIFVDVDKKTLSFDHEELKKALEEHPDVKGIFVTHLLGSPSDIPNIKKLCEGKDITIFEDCCESHGAHIENEKVGNFGEGSTFSFYFGHHMTTLEGGMVCTNNEELYKLLLLKRSHGLARSLPKEDYQKAKEEHPDVDPKFLFLTQGYNVRNHELAAVLGLVQLKKLNQFIEQRRANFEEYHKICQEHEDKLEVIHKEGNSSFSFPFIFKDNSLKARFKQLLDEHNIEHRPVISGNLLRQPFLKEEKHKQTGSYKNAEHIHQNGVYIGNNQFVDEERVGMLRDILRKL